MCTYDLPLFEKLKKGSETFGERALFSYKKGEAVVIVSYCDFVKDVQKIAYYLEERKLKGTYVVIEGKTQYEMIVALYAAVSMGAIAAVLNFALPEDELEYAMNLLKPSMIICSDENSEVAELYKDAPVCLFDDGEDTTETICNRLKEPGKLYEYTGGQKPEDPAVVLMTSGSTSRSKLVLLSQYVFYPNYAEYTERSILLSPLYHVGGTAILVTAVDKGLHLCLSDMKSGIQALEWFQPTDVIAVPSFLSYVADKAKKGQLDLSQIKRISSMGAAQNPETTKYFESLGILTPSVYGATEVCGAVTCSSEEHYRSGSVGITAPWNEVRISETGEILVKGKNVMLEYVGAPEATKEAMTDGWYHTGDIGHFDEDGFLFVTGRTKNIIVLSNGENVSPEAIEAQLYLCPEIAEVFVRGEDDTLAAHVWCGEIAEEETKKKVEDYIKKYNRSVPSYRCIRKTVFREMPFERSVSGKLKRI